jgi:lipid A disaccharide synthetase
MSESHPVSMAVDIESRQDEVLRLLDELNERIERTLADLPSLKLRATVARQEQKRAA